MNVAIAAFYETYKLLYDNIDKKIDNETYRKNLIKICITLIPFIPHLAYEFLDLLGEQNPEIWPKIISEGQTDIQLAIQINGKTREIITVKKDNDIKELEPQILKSQKIVKFIKGKKIFKTIFVKNKIVNYLVK